MGRLMHIHAGVDGAVDIDCNHHTAPVNRSSRRLILGQFRRQRLSHHGFTILCRIQSQPVFGALKAYSCLSLFPSRFHINSFLHNAPPYMISGRDTHTCYSTCKPGGDSSGQESAAEKEVSRTLARDIPFTLLRFRKFKKLSQQGTVGLDTGSPCRMKKECKAKGASISWTGCPSEAEAFKCSQVGAKPRAAVKKKTRRTGPFN